MQFTQRNASCCDFREVKSAISNDRDFHLREIRHQFLSLITLEARAGNLRIDSGILTDRDSKPIRKLLTQECAHRAALEILEISIELIDFSRRNPVEAEPCVRIFARQ